MERENYDKRAKVVSSCHHELVEELKALYKRKEISFDAWSKLKKLASDQNGRMMEYRHLLNPKSDVSYQLNKLGFQNRQSESRLQLEFSTLKAEITALHDRMKESATENDLEHHLSSLYAGVDQLVHTERVTKSDVSISMEKLMLAFSEQFRQLTSQVSQMQESIGQVTSRLDRMEQNSIARSGQSVNHR